MMRSLLVVTARTTKLEIQHEIEELRECVRNPCCPGHAREYAAQADALLDPWLAREPEPV